jgi:pyruvate dehydrogenase E2 component (dihydrolipoamide acetyltransferase)
VSNLRAFTMPKWGIEMIEGTLAEWNIKEGEPISKGQVIAQIETDKIINEVQAEFDLTFVRLLAMPGEVYPVGALLGVTASGSAGAAEIDAFVRSFRRAGAPEGETNAVGENEAALAAHPAGANPAGAAAKPAPTVGISPGAQQLAQRLGVDVGRVDGTGRRGRITYQDVDQASKPARSVGGGSAVSIAPESAALDIYYASPLAKRLAVKHHLDLSTLRGTGPRGRISRKDVATAAGVSSDLGRSDPAFEVLRMSSMRKAIARQLTHSKSTIPHFYLRTQVNLEVLLAMRAEHKRNAGSAPSVNDYCVRAAALALMEAPDVNIQVHGDEIRRFRDADISIAVATDKGLITPIIRAAQTKSVQLLSRELRDAIERARAGKLRMDEIEGGSFTVSNLGMFGIDQFDAIINPPQGAILAIGSASRRPIERDGVLAIATTLHLSVSCDHRAIDGAVGARFLAALRGFLEAPQKL